MCTERVLCAGFGGQGVMSLGQMLAYGGMLEGKQVSWMPSYGPEMRGGTAYCSVVVSDRPVGSPIVTTNASCAIIMNLPSLEKFETSVVAGGAIFVNSSLVHRPVKRTDVRVYEIPANDLAAACGNPKAANMVMLGAYLAVSRELTLDSILEGFRKVFGAKAERMLAGNVKALQAGAAAVDPASELKRAA